MTRSARNSDSERTSCQNSRLLRPQQDAHACTCVTLCTYFCRSDLVHVEVFIGGGSCGEATIGSRYEGCETVGVSVHDSYKSFGGHGAFGHAVVCRSIETWLEGCCVSHCKECSWGEMSKCSKSRLFSAEE